MQKDEQNGYPTILSCTYFQLIKTQTAVPEIESLLKSSKHFIIFYEPSYQGMITIKVK